METKFKWQIINIILPLVPLVLRAIVKLFMVHIDINLIHASELWFVLAIIALIISQDLKLRSEPLDNIDKQEERSDRASSFILLGIIFVFFCPISEMFTILAEKKDNIIYQVSHILLTVFCYLCTYLTIKYSLKTQREFNLKSNFL